MMIGEPVLRMTMKLPGVGSSSMWQAYSQLFFHSCSRSRARKRGSV